MKVCIYGAGAIGGLFAARLAHHADVSLVARGATLASLQEHGLRLQTGTTIDHVRVTVTDEPATLGPQDLVILAVKGQALPDIADRLAPLLGPDTAILSAMNGVPWWFFEGFGGALAGTRLSSVDPDGRMARSIDARRLIGSVIHLTCSTREPGLVHHGFGQGLILGEPSGHVSERLQGLAELFRRAGFEVSLSDSIQKDIWYKLWGNMTMNPVSALTGATCDRILDEPLTREFCLKVMAEAAQIGAAIGCPIAQSGEDRMNVTRKLGAFKTSMLQDAEAGRALEVETLVGAVREIGQKLGIATPWTDALLGLTRLKNASLTRTD